GDLVADEEQQALHQVPQVAPRRLAVLHLAAEPDHPPADDDGADSHQEHELDRDFLAEDVDGRQVDLDPGGLEEREVLAVLDVLERVDLLAGHHRALRSRPSKLVSTTSAVCFVGWAESSRPTTRRLGCRWASK